MAWKVEHRPEENHEPRDYFRTEAYDSPAMKKRQEELTERALELIALEPGSHILDAGCGTGFSTQVIQKAGFTVKGVDLLESMVEKAREKGLDVQKADMTDLPFQDKLFDAIISISAFQWVRDWKKAAKEFKRVLKPHGKVVIQFYPESEEEARRVAKVFASQGFQGGLVIDNPDLARKRKVFLVEKTS